MVKPPRWGASTGPTPGKCRLARSPTRQALSIDVGGRMGGAASGGLWSSTPRNLRSGWRERDEPDFRYVGIGFRVAMTLSKETSP